MALSINPGYKYQNVKQDIVYILGLKSLVVILSGISRNDINSRVENINYKFNVLYWLWNSKFIVMFVLIAYLSSLYLHHKR